MSFSPSPVLEFKYFFDDEGKDFGDYINGIPENVLKRVAPALLSFDITDNTRSDPEYLFHFWLGENHPDLAEIISKYEELRKKSNKKWRLIFPYTSLQIVEKILKETSAEDEADSEDGNLNLLKAYLKLNQSYVEYYDPKISETTSDLYGYLKLAGVMVCMSLKDNDITNYNINIVFGASFIKVIHLFEFMESDEFFNPLIKSILDMYNLKSWKEYLIRLTGIVRFAINKENTNKYSQITFEEGEDLTLFDDLDYDFELANDQLDFIGIRSNPLIKIEDRTYVIISDLFLVQKLYKGTYWLLMRLATSKRQQDDLRQKITYEFSEKYLLYKVLGDVFSNFVTHTGDEISQSGINGFVDYYARNSNDIYLFESKDIFISAPTKASGDWIKIEEELKKKLWYEEKEGGGRTPKAILQLLNSIKLIISNAFHVDSSLRNESRAVFYPILVVHDEVFNAPGLNTVINNWFRGELLKDEELKKIDNRIKGITLIDINTLIFNKSVLEVKPNFLKTAINRMYLDFRKLSAPSDLIINRSEEEVKKSMVPFEHYLDNEIPTETKRSPKEFLESAAKLFED